MQRRTLLKTAGGIGATATIGGLGLFALSGSAAAGATGNMNYGNVSVTSDDGTVEYVAIYGDSEVSWDGFDEPAEEVAISMEARHHGDDGWTELYTTGKRSLDDFGGNDEAVTIGDEDTDEATAGTIYSAIGLDENGEHDETIDWHIVGSDPDGYGLPTDSLDTASLEVDGDGASETFTVQVRTTYTWYDADGNTIFTEDWTSDINVSVNNEKSSASAGDGDGEDGVVAG